MWIKFIGMSKNIPKVRIGKGKTPQMSFTKATFGHFNKLKITDLAVLYIDKDKKLLKVVFISKAEEGSVKFKHSLRRKFDYMFISVQTLLKQFELEQFMGKSYYLSALSYVKNENALIIDLTKGTK